MSLKKRSIRSSRKSTLKNNNIFNFEETKELIQKLKVDTLINTNLLDITDYKNNQDYFKSNIFIKKDPNLTRMWLMHLLGGGASAEHFFNHNGTIRGNSQIHSEILRILSWRGTELNDYHYYQQISKNLKKTWGKVMLSMSYVKQITFFVNTFVKRFLQFLNLGETSKGKDLKTTFSLYLSSSLGLTSFLFDNEYNYILKKLFNTELPDKSSDNLLHNIFSKGKSSVKLFLVSLVLCSLVISSYESYYYQIERDYLRKYLRQGLNEHHKSQISRFKEILFDFNNQVSEISTLENSKLFDLIDLYYDRNFVSSIPSFFRRYCLKSILKKELSEKNSLSHFYKRIKNDQKIIPLAIYFFNQRGVPRNTREAVCSIIIGLKSISSSSMKMIHQASIISKKRQLNLTKKKVG